MSTKRIGDWGEALAAGYLEAEGYRVLNRNYRYRRTEIDLVCRAPMGELVFVEVKTRTGRGFGPPEAAVTVEKRRRIIRTARAYLHEHRLEDTPVRFDVIAVLLRGREPEVEHFKDAFWAN